MKTFLEILFEGASNIVVDSGGPWMCTVCVRLGGGERE